MDNMQFADLINIKCREAFEKSKSKGWHDDPNRNKGEMIALMHSELSEALEALRTNSKDSHLPNYPGEVVEFADTIIRIFDYCGRFDLPLGEAIIEKQTYNDNRPYKHGNKLF